MSKDTLFPCIESTTLSPRHQADETSQRISEHNIFFHATEFWGSLLCSIVTAKDLDSEEEHMKQMDKVTILLMPATFLQLSSMFLHNGLENDVSMVAGLEFLN